MASTSSSPKSGSSSWTHRCPSPRARSQPWPSVLCQALRASRVLATQPEECGPSPAWAHCLGLSCPDSRQGSLRRLPVRCPGPAQRLWNWLRRGPLSLPWLQTEFSSRACPSEPGSLPPSDCGHPALPHSPGSPPWARHILFSLWSPHGLPFSEVRATPLGLGEGPVGWHPHSW